MGCNCATRPQRCSPNSNSSLGLPRLTLRLLDLGVEDHGTAAPLSVRKADAALDLLEDLLAIELILATDLLSDLRRPRLCSAPAQRRPFDMVEESIAPADPRPDAVHRALRERFPVRQVGGSAANGQSAAR